MRACTQRDCICLFNLTSYQKCSRLDQIFQKANRGQQAAPIRIPKGHDVCESVCFIQVAILGL
jgi:hypothetical protein